MSNNDTTFGDKVKFFRSKKGWKQQTLADKADLHQSEISKIERGLYAEQRKILSENLLRRLKSSLEY
jgi:transcriptional regulator with XRE-family HTH domain